MSGLAFHMVIWIDHQSAKLNTFTAGGLSAIAVEQSGSADRHIHHKAGTTGSGHAGLDRSFLEEIVRGIGDAREILIVGPAQAKQGLMKYLREHSPAVAARVVGVEAMGQASPEEIHALARRFFRATDRMIPPAAR